ncbi:MAG TPA: DUF2911 domain-containing protein [Vicinamibacterales bacterium]
MRLTTMLALGPLLVLVGSLSGPPVFAQELSELSLPPNGDNQKAEVSQWIGLVKVTIAYHSPNVHGGGGADRTGHIWGELLHYGFVDEGFGPSHATPWRAGANESTMVSFSHDVMVNGKPLAAGTYALFLDLEQSGPWSWIFSKQIGWGSFQYDPANDVLRVQANPEAATYTEFMTYGFDDRRPASAIAFLQWENKRVPFKIDVPNVNDLYIAQIRKDLQSWPGFNYQNWQAAAQFAVANHLALEEALVWANKAISEPFRAAAMGREDFSTLATKASVLHALGRESDADTTMDHALHLDGANAVILHQYGMNLLAAGRKERAMTVFQLNRQRHPDDKFWPNLGLARGYTAIGDKARAIASWEVALQNVPPSQMANRPALERALQALKATP